MAKQLVDKLVKLTAYADFSALIKQQRNAELSQNLKLVLKHYVRLRQQSGLPTRGAFFFKCQAAQSMIAALDKPGSPATLVFPSFKVQDMVQDGLMSHLFRLFKEKCPTCRVEVREAAGKGISHSSKPTSALIGHVLAVSTEALIAEVLDGYDPECVEMLSADDDTCSVSTISTSDSEGTASTLSANSSDSLDEFELSGDDSSIDLEYSSDEEESRARQRHLVSI